MKVALSIFSWISVVLGALAIVGASADPAPAYPFIGGALFLTEGILALAYIKSE